MLDLTTKTSAELVVLLRTIPIVAWNSAVVEARKKDAYWRANLYRANLNRADLRRANLTSANLTSANLHGANLRSANLHGANLRSANLHGADLRSANLHGADLRSANLDSANLTRANLNRANLCGANLRGANLHGADLRSANLHGADLRSANLNRANLTSANLNKVLIDGEPITIEQWCDIFDMPTTSKGLRVGFKRLPNDRITGRNYNKGKHLIEWKVNRWVEAPDWNDSEECGGGLHLSPTATMTRSYSSDSLCIAVAFDPKEAVMMGDKLKVRRCKVL